MIPSIIVPITYKEILDATITAISINKNIILEFEQELSKYLKCEYVISTGSGTSALYVLLKAFGLEKNDEVVVPAYTCESVGRLIIDMGYNVKFVDVNKETYNISMEDLRSKISKNSKAIIAIHMFGSPCEIKDIREIADDYNSIVIEDAAQSIGAEYCGDKIGTLGDAGFFSLGEAKALTTINGGFIVTDDKGIANSSRKIIEDFKEVGRRKKADLLIKLLVYYMLKNPYFYDLIYKVVQSRRLERRNNLKECADLNQFKYKYTDMQASIGMIQLSNLEYFNGLRIKNSSFLIDNLKDINGIHLPKIARNSKPIFLRLPIWIENISEGQREDLIGMLQKSGIDTPVAYPNSLPQFFRNLNGFPNTEELVKKTITLPTHPLVNNNDLEKIALTIDEFVTKKY